MKAHEIDHTIHGNDMQYVDIELDPSETVIAEAGAMLCMDGSIRFETKMGDGSDPQAGFFGKLLSAGKRFLSGESIFMTHFTNHGAGKARVSFASPFPGKIIPLNLANFKGDIICQKESFLCAALGTKLGIAWTKKLGAGFFGGEGFILERISGDGMAFIHACGAIIEKDLDNQTIRVDTGCIVAFEDGIEYSIESAGSLKSMIFGGEGIFLATLSGKGKVWLQSLPFSALAQRILAHAPSGAKGGGQTGDRGSILGNLFEE